MARNELTKNAKVIADLMYRKGAEKSDKEIAISIGIDPSNLCRFKTNYLEMVAAYLDEIGLSVHIKNDDKPVPKEVLRSLSVLAELGLASAKDEYLGK
ncbi:hypothetical protein [Actinobacillus pleuropneumoniae]|uniref:hypothetical protein n=1 Tax=Actinobacillus pleuropneumoniae TaxID=715 RepID=UPI002279A25E|nr:hypothetical protein [Actinobacillus pleuropneumoniae]MCY6396656.1 hypothetical protein [Actinobacillus pleuropneumoniae]MCY6410456.1 hypothetical protein [Actinobacillus pleuropneumoniae]MCY6428829.1 hypothetical protein [Actinobacillus pleuropneumoniae]